MCKEMKSRVVTYELVPECFQHMGSDESTDPDQQVFFMVYRKRACAILKFDSFYLSNLPGKTDRIVK